MYSSDDDDDEDLNKDFRSSKKQTEKRIIPDNELSDSEDDEITGAPAHRSARRRNQQNYGERPERSSLMAHDRGDDSAENVEVRNDIDPDAIDEDIRAMELEIDDEQEGDYDYGAKK